MMSENNFRPLPIADARENNHPEEIFQQISDKSPHPVIVMDRDGGIIYHNNAAGDLIESEDKGEKRFVGLKNSGISQYIKKIYSMKDTRSICSDPAEITDKHGETKIFCIEGSLVKEGFNNYYCFYLTDMTEKVLSEKALIRSEKDKTLILNSIHENLVYYDKDYRIVWANQDPAASVGLNPEELRGRVCYELWYGLESPCSDCTIKKVMESGEPLTEEKNKSGDRSIRVTAYPVFGDSGEIIGAVESILDISRRRKAEMALEETLKKYMELFTTMTNGFVLHEIITDESGKPYNFRFLDVNPAFEDMTGLFSAEMVGKTVLELFPDYNTEWIERYGRVARTGVPEEFNDYNAAFGKHYHIYAYSPKKGQFATIFSDISDIVALKKEQSGLIMQINKNFEQLAILNDEIRNPLQVMTGYAMMESSDCSEKIMSQIYAIDKLISELDKRWLESDKIREYLMKHHNYL